LIGPGSSVCCPQNSLFGGGGADTLIGGADTDHLEGGEGDDSYQFELGDSPVNAENLLEGVTDEDGVDTIVFGAGISVDDVSVHVANMGDMSLYYSASDKLYLVGGFSGSIENFRFADGLTLDWTQLVGRAYDAVVNLDVSGVGAVLLGGKQNDTLYSRYGFATFRGGRAATTPWACLRATPARATTPMSTTSATAPTPSATPAAGLTARAT